MISSHLRPQSRGTLATRVAALQKPLPAAMQERARRRLRMLATLTLPFVLLHVLLQLAGWLPPTPVGISAALVGLTVSLWFVTTSERFSTPFALHWGLAVQFGYTFVMAVPLTVHASRLFGRLVDPTPAYVIMLAYPLLVPMAPRHLIRGSLASAIAIPFGAWLAAEKAGLDVSPAEHLANLFLPAFCVCIAWYGAKVIYGVAQEAAAAAELGAYRLEEKIGAGGMGEVWRGSHRLLTRPAAIKLIRLGDTPSAGVDASTAQARFEREAQATAALYSPHTVQVYDFGTTDDGSFYYVMELLDGLDLERIVKQHGPLSAERVVAIARQVCHSLGEAHDSGLVHRDIKPANIFVCRHGRDADFVKVLDFGLVLPRRGRSSDARVTQEGVAPGTPAYMAPETATAPERVGPRADLYALGGVLYFLLTGQLVFEAGNAMQMIVAHASREPSAPSIAAELPVPAALDAVVLRLLAKEPEERFASADALLEALDAVELDAEWTQEKARAWWSLHDPQRIHPQAAGH